MNSNSYTGRSGFEVRAAGFKVLNESKDTKRRKEKKKGKIIITAQTHPLERMLLFSPGFIFHKDTVSRSMCRAVGGGPSWAGWKRQASFSPALSL